MLTNSSRYQRVARAARELIETEYSYEVIGREMDREYRAVRETFRGER
jgi:hypothetical protein